MLQERGMKEVFMMEKIINGVEVVAPEFITEKELAYCAEYAEHHIPKYDTLVSIHISKNVDGDFDVDWKAIAKFERIRRITGYLVGTIDRWNNAKRAEEHDRVKHGLMSARI